MPYTAMPIPTSPVTKGTANSFSKEHNGLSRSHSGKDLCSKAWMRRSHSDNHLCYSINRARASSTEPKLKNSPSTAIFPFQLSTSIIPDSVKSFLFNPETSKDMDVSEKEGTSDIEDHEETKRDNWLENVLEIRSLWRNKQLRDDVDDHGDESSNSDCNCDEDEGGCEVCYGSEDEGGEKRYDRESFSKLLVQVAWSDTKLYSKLAFLCNIAYKIPQIKADDLRRYYGLRFVTSSLEKKAEAEALKAKLDEDSVRVPVDASSMGDESNSEKQKELKQKRSSTRPYIAYEIAASAASYVQSRAKDFLSRGCESEQEGNIDGNGEQGREEGENPSRMYTSEAAAYMAASTMTAVVAAGEEEKQKAARDLQSLHSSPCEWFICDDTSTYTRCFVIQGSDSMASWQANLLFEPIEFEGTDVLVHRGIYEAAKGIYEQFMPEILDHLNRYGDRAKLQFTGHSLGGSLALLVNLMLLTRKVVKPSSLRAVVTFGSPFVFCGGQRILSELGLDENHVHCVMMHRDIVPRAFSCNYPDHISIVLKRIKSFRSHPCLTKNKLLYSPMGKIFILQPDEISSPPHPLLPSGSALYLLGKAQCGSLTSALKEFLNNPHPINTLSNPAAYGSDGTILRDHDSSNYLKAVNGVLRQHTKTVFRKVRKQRNMMWPLLVSPSPHSWTHERTLVDSSSRLASKEVMSGV